MMVRTAVVLLNLGGPDRLESVRPFLFNLFYDPAITELPAPLRWVFARLITARREKAVQANYALMGGRTPLVEETQAQIAGLEGALRGEEGEIRCFMAMRYWHPMSDAAAREVMAFAPDQVILLPLYPQYSAATTGSSLAAWQEAAAAAGLNAPVRTICCYPVEPEFIAAHVARIREVWPEAAAAGRPRLLFSAHGLPEAFIKKGDPYQWQVEQTCAAVVAALAIEDLDWRICYQSRVGPQKWIEPYTEAEVERAGHDRVPLVMCPIAFTSEHIETLVEMDREYAEVAHKAGVPKFVRVPTPSAHPTFIAALASMVRRQLQAPAGAPQLAAADLTRVCPAGWARCPCRAPVPVAGREPAEAAA
jgi:protoporphyrin/coproporphyrin ferrochelatase